MDLGDVFQQHQYVVRFPFTVVGEGPVRFSALEAGVGLTDAFGAPEKMLHQWLPLGYQGEIVATFDAGRYQNRKASHLSVRGDFEAQTVVLTVEAYVHPVFRVSPRILQFGDVLKSDWKENPPERIVAIEAIRDFEVLEWIRKPPGMRIEDAGKTISGENGSVIQRYRVSLSPNIVEGRSSSSFLAETSLGVELEFMVSANILGKVKYSPSSRIAFGIFDQGATKKRTMRVESTPLLQPNMLPKPEVEILGDAAKVMQVEVMTVNEDSWYEITVNIGNQAPAGSYNGVLRLTYPEGSGLAPKEMILNARIRLPR